MAASDGFVMRLPDGRLLWLCKGEMPLVWDRASRGWIPADGVSAAEVFRGARLPDSAMARLRSAGILPPRARNASSPSPTDPA